ncbi:universal stress protein [Halostagnicola kamekurae]|uniref:Nucleotide-binding universal stress protein, UspA family n=1 Tax=Halostagnicola kamekurae TaxID=619731 RepID=A0A1I6V0T5_9EURY|nr:universal stress protein [Halostagnicola kamekurae]SFT07273.1 Nucleotide-binding universal stress protein, UspA family [Halostagnicola kamekurae]
MGLRSVLLASRPGDEGHGTRLAQTAADIAKPANARVVVGQIFTKEEYKNSVTSLGFDDKSDVTPEQLASKHRTLRNIVDELDSQGIDYELNTATGPHADTIVNLAADADLTVIGGKNRTPAGKALFGSATQKVLLSAPCPVVFVRREH